MAVLSLITNSQTVSAHVLIQDKTRSVGAVLHITPDDDPIAGEESMLYFSFQTKTNAIKNAKVTVTDESGLSTEIKAMVRSDSLSATYTFPSRGAYTIKLSVNGQKNYHFEYSQRVSRGIGTDTGASDYPVVKAILIFASVGFLLTIIYFFNQRENILSQSKF